MILLHFDIRYITIFVITNVFLFDELRASENSDQYANCVVSVWNTSDMNADKYPSMFAIIQRGSDEEPTFHLPQFKTEGRELQIVLKSGEKLIFICRQNNLNIDSQTTECVNKTLLPEIKEMGKCKSSSEAKPSVQESKNSCGVGNKLLEIGYKIHPKYSKQRFLKVDPEETTKIFFDFIQVCINTEQKITLYTSHKIDGKIIGGRQITSSIPEDSFSMEGYHVIDQSFMSKGDNKKRTLQKIYKPERQFHHLYKLFSDETREYFDNEDSNFFPRQLTPDYDMLLKNWKALTHYYINTAPQWKMISCTWDALEDLIRERARRVEQEFIIYTGTHGILTLNDIKVYMSDEQLTIPKYFWKIVILKREKNYAAIAFITLNNPFGVDETDPCTSMCREKGWPINVETPGLGKTFCCEVGDLLSKLDITIEIKDVTSDDMINVANIKNILMVN